MSEPVICGCGRGYMSRHDNKCGNCRTKREKRDLEVLWKQHDRMKKAHAELQASIDKARSRISP